MSVDLLIQLHEQCKGLLAKSDGKDKTIALLQYAAMFASGGEPGTALDKSLELARQLAGFPQLCMRADRMSSYEQWDLEFEEAFAAESRGGLDVIKAGETVAGARRFKAGAGRHGSFE